MRKPSIWEYIWLFVLGSILGFILESLWHFFLYQEWINMQGLLFGPFKPIYGLGLVIIIFFLYRFKDRCLGQKFLMGVGLGSATEYLVSLFQEYVFLTSTWDYSAYPWNFAGRLFLPYCFFWGVLAIICIDYIYPKFYQVYKKFPKKIGGLFTILISLFMGVNVCLTILAVIRYSKANEQDSAVFKVIDTIYTDEYMKEKFPNWKVIQK